MGNNLISGQMGKKNMSKQQTIDYLVNKIENLQVELQQVQQFMQLMAQQLGLANRDANVIRGELQAIDYRTRTTLKMLTENKIFDEDAHQDMFIQLQIDDHNVLSADDDKRRGLIDVDTAVKVEDVVVFQLDATYPDMLKEYSKESPKEGEKLVPILKPHPKARERCEAFSILRSKINVGAGQPHPLIEDKLINMKVGEIKEFTLISLPQEFMGLAGQDLNFKVTIISVKELPKSIEKVAPIPESSNRSGA